MDRACLMTLSPILLSSWTFSPPTCVILIGAEQYEYSFASQSDLSKVIAQFNFGPGKALSMAKRRASSWRKLERETV